MARATATETADRVDQPQEMILAGEPNTAWLVLLMRDRCGGFPEHRATGC